MSASFLVPVSDPPSCYPPSWLQDLISGKRQVKIGVVGGSISWGTGPTIRGYTDWFSVFSRYMLAAFPNANVTLRNGCVPGKVGRG